LEVGFIKKKIVYLGSGTCSLLVFCYSNSYFKLYTWYIIYRLYTGYIVYKDIRQWVANRAYTDVVDIRNNLRNCD
jgi:hypothetical protein